MAEEPQSGQPIASGTGVESRLDVLPLHSTDLLTLLDESGIIQYESPSIERLYGFDQDELVGEQVADYFHPDDRERVLAAFDAVVSGEDHRVEAVEYRHEQADGTYEWIESVASTNPTPDGNYVVNSRDISERKQRERELRRAREAVESERDAKEAIRRLLLQTSTDGEIADSVCRLLVDSYGYEAAWVVRNHGGGSDGDAGTLWLANYGPDRGFRTGDGTELSVDGATRRVLAGDDSVTVTTDADGEEALADRLEECGLYSVRSVPLDHDGITYGALTAVRTEPGNEFAGGLVDEVAAALAFKRRVHRQQEALVADTVTELEIRIAGGHFLAKLSAAPGIPPDATLAADELRRDDEGTIPYFVKTRDVDAATLEATASDLESTGEVALVTADDDTPVVRVRVEPPSLGTVLAGHGGVVQSMTACDGHLDVTVQFPRRTDLGTVVEAVRDHWPDATMHARNERPVEDERPGAFDSLTEKQEDALRAATIAGFFERPQGASAEDVAETLGVSPSTFLHHLRSAEQKVFADAFASESDET